MLFACGFIKMVNVSRNQVLVIRLNQAIYLWAGSYLDVMKFLEI